MARPQPPPGPLGARPAEDRPQGDPWHAFGYLVSGVLTYGAIGFVAALLTPETFGPARRAQVDALTRDSEQREALSSGQGR